jgi:hypothetical protein
MRVRRDLFGRSTIGALFTDRSLSNVNPGERNDLFGVDGLFTFFQNVRINSYLARSRTPGAAGDEWSYRGQFEWAPDRYGFFVERLKIGDDFNPEVGFMRRSDFTKTALSARFSPRPARDGFFGRRVRKFYYEVNWDYFQTPTGRLESRNAGAGFRSEFQNGDNFNANYIRSYDSLDAPFQIGAGVRLPVGTYQWQQGTVSYQLGTQRRVSGTTSFTGGSYYNGTQRTLSYRGRIAAATRLSLEPSVSINWLDLDQGKFTTKLVGTRVTTPLTPRMFASVLLQYNSSNNSFSSNARFRWEYQPGSELFVVFTEGRNTIGPGYPGLDTRGFVVKINRLFRM